MGTHFPQFATVPLAVGAGAGLEKAVNWLDSRANRMVTYVAVEMNVPVGATVTEGGT